MDTNEVGGPITTTTKEEKDQQAVVAVEIQNQNMTSHASNATIVKFLDITFLNVKLQTIIKLKSRPITLTKEVKKIVAYCWHIMKEVTVINDT